MKKIIFYLSFLLIFSVFFINSNQRNFSNIEWFSTIHKNIPPLDFKDNQYSQEILDYFSYYQLDFPDVEHYFGYYKYEQQQLVAHVFIPENPRATFFTFHGYMDHSGYLVHLIDYLIKNQYIVVAMDLQGHGLSQGDRYAIEDMALYADSLEKLLRICLPYIKPPYHTIGFSTGSIIIYEYLYRYPAIFEKIIFVCPYFHSSSWDFSNFGLQVFEGIFENLPRSFPKDSGNKDFLYFRKKVDPLQEKRFSVNWLKALIKWNERVINYPPVPVPLYVIQASNDKTIDIEYNLKFLKEHTKSIEIRKIEGRHHLFNETPEVLAILFQQLDIILSN
ncbi:MAG: lysophospholipase [Spirochaetes bacterium]|nr:lysophospholipase [Spirochaetota bacterium]